MSYIGSKRSSSLVSFDEGTIGSGVVFPAGHVIQVKSVNLGTQFSVVVSSSGFEDVVGLSIPLTVKEGNSVLVCANVIATGSTTSLSYPDLWEMRVLRDSTVLGYNDVARYNTSSSSFIGDKYIQLIDSNLTAGTYTYKVQVGNQYSGGNNYVYVNQNGMSGGTGYTSISNITVYEIQS
jgi:hypothetical protein